MKRSKIALAGSLVAAVISGGTLIYPAAGQSVETSVETEFLDQPVQTTVAVAVDLALGQQFTPRGLPPGR